VEKDKTNRGEGNQGVGGRFVFTAERQKHIHLTDQSEHGWDVVTDYIGHSFGDDEADNKRWKTLTGQQELRKHGELQPLENLRGLTGSHSSLATAEIMAVKLRRYELSSTTGILPPGPVLLPKSGETAIQKASWAVLPVQQDGTHSG